MKRYLGCHVSAAGGLEQAAINGRELGVNTIQLHPSAPQRWTTKIYPAGVEEQFCVARESSGIDKVFFHGVYLINLASPDPQQFHLSKLSLVSYLDLNARMGGDGVIFHVGSNKDQLDESVGFARAAEGINWVLDNSKNNARLILEVAAGGGKVIGDRTEELATIYDQIEQKDRVGFGLDTQHMWASGYDLVGGAPAVIAEIEKNFTFEKVWAIHLNDSKTALASRKDRHENLGQGEIGDAALAGFINHPKLRNIPVILETPGLKEMDTAKIEVKKLIEMAG